MMEEKTNSKISPWADVIKAWANGVPCEFRILNEDPPKWVDLPQPGQGLVLWCERGIEYRIKPKSRKLRYRVALLAEKGGQPWTTTAVNEGLAAQIEAGCFLRWLTDWVEVEVEVEQ